MLPILSAKQLEDDRKIYPLLCNEFIKDLDKIGVDTERLTHNLEPSIIFKNRDKGIEAFKLIIKYYRNSKHFHFKDALLQTFHYAKFDGVVPTLIELLKNTNDYIYLRFLIAGSLRSLKDKKFVSDYIDLITNENYVFKGLHRIEHEYRGWHEKMIDYRGPLLYLLGLIKQKQYIDLIASFLNDKECREGALLGLIEMKDVSIINYLEPFLNDSDKEFRSEVRRGIKKVQKYHERKEQRKNVL